MVYLVRKLDNGVFYAMKSVDKRLMLERDKEELIFNERLILSKLNHRRLIQLYYAFQTVIIIIKLEIETILCAGLLSWW